MIEVVILVILIILLFVIVVKSYRLVGGEYFGLYADGKMEILSPSQRHALESNDGTIDEKISCSCEVFKNDITWNIAGVPAILSSATPGKLSDAHIDLEIANSIIKPTSGFSVCEANTSIVRGAKIEFHNNISSHIVDHNVVVDRTSPYEFTLPEIKRHVYVEFTYTTIHDRAILEAYRNIHMFMKKVFTHLNSIETGKKLIVVYRFSVNSDGTLNETISEIARVENDDILIIGHTNYEQTSQKIKVPDSTDSFDMDEFINIDDTFIQVEHSEGGKSHKSNIIEFIIRSVHYFSDSALIDVAVDDDMLRYFNAKNSIERLCKDRKCKEIRRELDNFIVKKNKDGSDNKRDLTRKNRLEEQLAEYDREIRPFKDTMSKITFDNLYPLQMIKLFILYFHYDFDKYKLVCSKQITNSSPFYTAWNNFARNYLDYRPPGV